MKIKYQMFFLVVNYHRNSGIVHIVTDMQPSNTRQNAFSQTMKWKMNCFTPSKLKWEIIQNQKQKINCNIVCATSCCNNHIPIEKSILKLNQRFDWRPDWQKKNSTFGQKNFIEHFSIVQGKSVQKIWLFFSTSPEQEQSNNAVAHYPLLLL